MVKQYDVIIVGAGPGGCTAAKTIAEKGLKVAVLEKNPDFGRKLCAGGLIPAVLKDFDVSDEVIECRIKNHCICSPNDKSGIAVPSAEVTVYRTNFDTYLAQRAKEERVDFFMSMSANGVIENKGKIVGVTARTGNIIHDFRAKIVIASDGFYSLTARSAGLLPRYKSDEVALAAQFETYTKDNVDKDTVYLFLDDRIALCGYGWAHPKRRGYSIGVGCLLSHMNGVKITKKLQIMENEYFNVSRITAGAHDKTKMKVACIPMIQSPKTYRDGLMVVGDAAGQVDPLNGDGIYYSMKAGELAGQTAIDSIITNDCSEEKLSEYQRKWDREFGSFLRNRRVKLEKIKDKFNQIIYAERCKKKHGNIEQLLNLGRRLSGLRARL